MKPKAFTEKVHDFLASPRIFIAAGFVYLLISTAAAFDPALDLNGIEMTSPILTFSVFLFGLASFYIGIRTGRHALKLSYFPVLAAIFLGIITAHFVLNLNPAFSVVFVLGTLLLSYILLFSKMKWEYVFTAGTFLLWLSYALNGLPVMDMNLHKDLFANVNPMFMTGFFLMTYSLAMIHPKRKYLWMFLVLSLALSTFRLYMGIAFITWVLLELREKRNMRNLSAIAIAAAVVCAIFVLTGYSLMSWNHTTWNLDPMRTLEHRLAFTMTVFDDIVNISFPWGHTFGASLTMESTEFTCRLLYGYDDRITSTAFGESMLNFGLIGIFLVSWWLGAVLENLYRKDYRLYAILTAMLIATLDVGINILVILCFIYLGWLRVIRHEKR